MKDRAGFWFCMWILWILVIPPAVIFAPTLLR